MHRAPLAFLLSSALCAAGFASHLGCSAFEANASNASGSPDAALLDASSGVDGSPTANVSDGGDGGGGDGGDGDDENRFAFGLPPCATSEPPPSLNTVRFLTAGTPSGWSFQTQGGCCTVAHDPEGARTPGSLLAAVSLSSGEHGSAQIHRSIGSGLAWLSTRFAVRIDPTPGPLYSEVGVIPQLALDSKSIRFFLATGNGNGMITAIGGYYDGANTTDSPQEPLLEEPLEPTWYDAEILVEAPGGEPKARAKFHLENRESGAQADQSLEIDSLAATSAILKAGIDYSSRTGGTVSTYTVAVDDIRVRYCAK